jgi:hypothetical protein
MINNMNTYKTNFQHEGEVYHTHVTIEVTDDGEIVDWWLDWIEPDSNIGGDDGLPEQVRQEFAEMAVAEYKRRLIDLRI